MIFPLIQETCKTLGVEMRIARFMDEKGAKYGVLDGEMVQGLIGDPYNRLERENYYRKLSEIRLLAPCSPSKIVALGLNYRSHVEEVKAAAAPAEPLIFLKPSTSLIGPDDNIVYPESSNQVDYEGELGVVIRSRAKRVHRDEAMNYVLGYTCFNDVTARDLQRKDKQWTRAKSFDTFAAIGPWIETELDPGEVYVETYLNGELKQRANTHDLIYPVSELVSFISHIMTLLPGDVIATGTPAGIGPMQPGDIVEVKIERIGILRNQVVRPDPV